MAPMIRSRLTSKAQTIIPLPVRAALGLQPGDEVAYRIEDAGRCVVLKRVPPGTTEDPFALFTEWEGSADTPAYAKL